MLTSCPRPLCSADSVEEILVTAHAHGETENIRRSVQHRLWARWSARLFFSPLLCVGVWGCVCACWVGFVRVGVGMFVCMHAYSSMVTRPSAWRAMHAVDVCVRSTLHSALSVLHVVREVYLTIISGYSESDSSRKNPLV